MPQQCIVLSDQAKGKKYYYTIPANDRNYRTLDDLRMHRIGLKDVEKEIKSSKLMDKAGIEVDDLLKFPRFQKN